MRANYIEINYSLFSLLQRDLYLDQVLADSIYIYLSEDSTFSESLPLSNLFEENDIKKGEESFQLQLANLRFNNLFINDRDEDIPLGLQIRNTRIHYRNIPKGLSSLDILTDSGDISYFQKPILIKNLKSKFIIDNEYIKMDTLSLDVSRLKVTGTGRLVLNHEDNGLEARLLINGDPSGLLSQISNDSFSDIMPLSGYINLEIMLLGQLSRPDIRCRLEFPNMTLQEFPIYEGKIHAEYKNDVIRLQGFQFKIMNGFVSGEGFIHTDSTFLHSVELEINNISIQNIYRVIFHEASPYTGEIRGRIRSDGVINDPGKLRFSSKLLMRNIIYNGRMMPEFSIEAIYKNRHAQLSFEHGVSILGVQLDLSGKERLDGRINGDINNLLEIALLLNINDLQGSLKVNGKISGSLTNPIITADLSGHHLSYQFFPVDSIAARIEIKDKTFHIKDLEAKGQIRLNTESKRPFNLEKLSGTCQYQVNIAGMLSKLDGRINAQLQNFGYDSLLFDQGYLRVSYFEDEIQIETCILTIDSVTFNIQGRGFLSSRSGQYQIGLRYSDRRAITVDQFSNAIIKDGAGINHGVIFGDFDLSDHDDWQINMEGSHINLNLLSKLNFISKRISGLLDFNFSSLGNYANPSADLSIKIKTPQYENIIFDSLETSVNITDKKLSLKNLDLYVEGENTNITGELRLEPDYSLSRHSIVWFNIKCDTSNLAIMNAILSPEQEISGHASYDINYTLEDNRPEVMGYIRLSDGKFSLNTESPPLTDLHMNAIFRDSIIYLPELSGEINRLPFFIHGNLTGHPWTRVKGKVRCMVLDSLAALLEGEIAEDSLRCSININNLDIKSIQTFLPDVHDMNGILNSQIFISGATNDPYIAGNIQIRALKFLLHNPDLLISHGKIAINLEKNTIILDTLSFTINQGSLFATGKTNYDNGKINALTLKADINKVRLSHDKNYFVTVKSGNLDIQKRNQDYNIDGDVLLGETKFLYNLQPKKFLTLFSAAEKQDKNKFPFLKQLKLNIRVRDDENTWIDNNIAKLRLYTNLNIIGNASRPNLSGRLQVLEGYIIYLDRDFKVEEGILDFIDPNQMNPLVNLKAIATIKSYQTLVGIPYTIVLSLQGPIDQLEFELQSDPPLDKPDIVALLTLGATRAQLTQKEGNQNVSFDEVIKDRVSVISSKKISGFAARSVGNLLGLEQVTIEGNLFKFGKSWGPQLLASKKISERMDITYGTRVGHLNDQRIKLDYQLSKYFLLQGQTDQRGRSIIDIVYRLRFK